VRVAIVVVHAAAIIAAVAIDVVLRCCCCFFGSVFLQAWLSDSNIFRKNIKMALGSSN